MKFLTLIALLSGIFNSLWLCHVFVVLAMQGEYLVTESMQWVAGFEIVLTLSMAGLGIYKLCTLREV